MSSDVPRQPLTTVCTDKELVPYGITAPYDEFFQSRSILAIAGDGHCFINALVSSNTSNLPLSNEIILDTLERFINSEKESIYMFAACRNSNELLSFFNNYRWLKIYDNVFGDSIPFFTAKALDISIVICEVIGNLVRQTKLNFQSEIKIEILRSGSHYDALIKKIARQLSRTLNSRIFKK